MPSTDLTNIPDPGSFLNYDPVTAIIWFSAAIIMGVLKILHHNNKLPFILNCKALTDYVMTLSRRTEKEISDIKIVYQSEIVNIIEDMGTNASSIIIDWFDKIWTSCPDLTCSGSRSKSFSAAVDIASFKIREMAFNWSQLSAIQALSADSDYGKGIKSFCDGKFNKYLSTIRDEIRRYYCKYEELKPLFNKSDEDVEYLKMEASLKNLFYETMTSVVERIKKRDSKIKLCELEFKNSISKKTGIKNVYTY